MKLPLKEVVSDLPLVTWSSIPSLVRSLILVEALIGVRYRDSPVTHIGPMHITMAEGPAVWPGSDASVSTAAPDTGNPAVVLGLLVVRSKRVEPRGMGAVAVALTLTIPAIIDLVGIPLALRVVVAMGRGTLPSATHYIALTRADHFLVPADAPWRRKRDLAALMLPATMPFALPRNCIQAPISLGPSGCTSLILGWATGASS